MFSRLIIILCFAWALTGCGGGDDSEPEPGSNNRPVARISAASEVNTGSIIELDGRNSSDADGHSLTYAWILSSKPSGSSAALSSSSSSIVRFTADIDGSYTVSLIVNDGTANSIQTNHNVTATTKPNNVPSITSFDSDPSEVALNDTVTFNWEVVDADNEPLNCQIDIIGDASALIPITNCHEINSYQASYAEIGSFSPRLYVSDPHNGQDTATSSVIVTGDIVLSITAPNEEAVVDHQFDVKASLSTVYDIATITASIVGESISETMQLSCDTCTNTFIATLDMAGLDPGTYSIKVTVVDVKGTTATTYRRIIFDSPSELTVISPLDGDVVQTSVLLFATCLDDVASCSITAHIGNTLLAEGESEINTMVDLTDFDGSQQTIKFSSKDSLNQTTQVVRQIYIENSGTLSFVTKVDGTVLDINSDKILYFRSDSVSGDHLYIYDRHTEQSTQVAMSQLISLRTSNAFLTPTGAIFVANDLGGNVTSAKVFDWNNNEMVTYDRVNSASSLTVAGNYAIWNGALGGHTLYRKNVVSGEVIEVTKEAGNWRNDVGSNGTVAYWTSTPNYSVKSYANGVTTTLAADEEQWNTYIATDGNAFVYRKHDPCCNNQQYAIFYHDGIDETQLTDFSSNEPSRGSGFAINNGWVAYAKPGNTGQLHVWTQSPQGAHVQRTFFGSTSRLDTLGADGSLIFTYNNRRYYSLSGNDEVDLMSTLGKTWFVDGGWLVTIGNSVYRIDTN
jgi:hypothetical protein